VHLLTDQIEFADVVILNKVADAGPGKTDAARKIIRSLNADAKIIETNHSDVRRTRSSTPGCSISTRRMSTRCGPRSSTVSPTMCPRPRNTASRQLRLPRPAALRAGEDPGRPERRRCPA
jgi:hypothetical protein